MDIKHRKDYHQIFWHHGTEIWNTIVNGKVSVGMTKEMCKLSWGEPDDTNEIIMSGKTPVQWVYPGDYLYFDNGKLTTI